MVYEVHRKSPEGSVHSPNQRACSPDDDLDGVSGEAAAARATAATVTNLAMRAEFEGLAQDWLALASTALGQEKSQAEVLGREDDLSV